MRRLEQLGGLVTVDVGNFVIESFGGGRRRRRLRRRQVDDGRQAEMTGGGRHHGFGGLLLELSVEFVLERAQTPDERGLIDEKRGGLVDVRHHLLDGPDGVGQRAPPVITQAMPAFIDLADVIVERFGDADAVPGLGHLRTAAQRMHGAIDGLG